MKRIFYLFIVGIILLQTACISTPSEADECFAIESARCELRGRCQTSFDVEGCKYYYEEQCRARQIKPAFTDEQLDDCVLSIYDVNANGESPEECQILRDAVFESELCLTDDTGFLFPACAVLACDGADTDTGESEEETTSDNDTDVSEGLNP
ncbi:MAG: hypothetical protein JXX29_20975 [Deltaproteobacteria bacterium]|nr:hypothetical protein [Deltaproteobacteria bacterium]MBN2674168.1 hypothetical protein [Deltaproteobacteria bacterium]